MADSDSTVIPFPLAPRKRAMRAYDDYPYQIEAELHLALLLRQLAELQRQSVALTPADARAFTLLQARAKEMANLFRHAIVQAMERQP